MRPDQIRFFAVGELNELWMLAESSPSQDMGSLREESLKAIGLAFGQAVIVDLFFGGSKPAPNVNPTTPPVR
jgi:hypothetical protein